MCAHLLMGADLFFFQAHGLLQQIPEAGFARQPETYSRQMIDVLLHGMLAMPAKGRGKS